MSASSRTWWPLRSRVAYANHYLRVREDDVRLPDGRETVYTYIERPASVMIVPVTTDGRLLMVEQYRYPARRLSWEFPAGAVHDGEAPKHAARRELAEETGAQAANWQPLGAPFIAIGSGSDQVHIFLATDLTLGPPHHDSTEQGVMVQAHPPGDVRRMAAEGAIVCGLTLMALGLYQMRPA